MVLSIRQTPITTFAVGFSVFSGQTTANLLTSSDFTEFCATLDTEMKRLQALGVGSKKKQAEPLTEEEEILWQKGLLGDHSPQALLNTMVFMNGP